MEDSAWGFLLDENVDRDTAELLEADGHRAELVVDALEPGADDRSEVLPYARREDLVIVTKDVSDFDSLLPGNHEGIVLIFDHELGGYEIATGLGNIAAAYPSRDALRGREILDSWVSC